MVNDTMPYALAIYEVAQEAQMEESYKKVIKELVDIWEHEKDFVKALSHPKISIEAKKQWLLDLFCDSLDPTMMQVLLVLNEHHVIARLPEIYQNYLVCDRKARNIEIVHVQSASKLSDSQQEALQKMLEEKMKKKIELDIHIHPELIAGMRVHAGDIVLDNTILSHLEAMKEELKIS